MTYYGCSHLTGWSWGHTQSPRGVGGSLCWGSAMLGVPALRGGASGPPGGEPQAVLTAARDHCPQSHECASLEACVVRQTSGPGASVCGGCRRPMNTPREISTAFDNQDATPGIQCPVRAREQSVGFGTGRLSVQHPPWPLEMRAVSGQLGGL